jgi:hypothetical protein
MIKTRKSLVPMISKVIKQNHPYEVPEIISFDISDGSKEYIDWIMRSTTFPIDILNQNSNNKQFFDEHYPRKESCLKKR